MSPILTAVLTAPLAFAQSEPSSPDIDAQIFRPSIDAGHTLWTDDTGREGLGEDGGDFLARGVLHYANRPATFVYDDGQTVPIVSDVLQMSLMAAYVRGPFRIGLDAPILLRTAGVEGQETGLGDLGLEARVRILHRDRAPLGLGVLGRVSFPTTTVDAALGSRGVGYEVSVLADRRFGPVLLAANVGTRGVPRSELENFTWNDQLRARLGLGVEVVPDRAGVSLDVGSNINYANVVPGSTPAEAILGGWGRLSDRLVVRGGVGAGLTNGFGAPRARVITALAYEPPIERAPEDADADGIVDPDDACPDRPEDLDDYEDDDGCPEPTLVTVDVLTPEGRSAAGRWLADGPEERNGKPGDQVGLSDGSYTFEAFADGFEPLEQRVEIPPGGPMTVSLTLSDEPVPAASLTVKITDETGTAIDGATWSLVDSDMTDLSPEERVEVPIGTLEIRASAEGYRSAIQSLEVAPGDKSQLGFSLAEARVEVTTERIEIDESIFFETNRATIKPESFDLLDEVSELLVEHPELVRIRIEGHTDSRGSASYNLELSEARAASVRAYLIQKGVEGNRMESEGFGESRPEVEGDGEAVWARNRRVDFFVVERTDDTDGADDAGDEEE